MELILMALFGGGYGDWNDIANTEYDWENIFELLKEKYGSLDNVDINNIYTTIMEMGQIDFMAMIDEYIKENKDNKDKEVKRIVEKLSYFDFQDEKNWTIYANCLDSHLYLYVDDTEIYDILNNYLEDEIEKINDKIGFTYIDIQER